MHRSLSRLRVQPQPPTLRLLPLMLPLRRPRRPLLKHRLHLKHLLLQRHRLRLKHLPRLLKAVLPLRLRLHQLTVLQPPPLRLLLPSKASKSNLPHLQPGPARPGFLLAAIPVQTDGRLFANQFRDRSAVDPDIGGPECNGDDAQ